MWESCLVLMLFFSPTFEFFEATFPLSWAEIATHLGSSCLCPNRTSLLFYLIRFRGPAMVGSFGFFKEVIFLISQASEGLKITGWKSERQSCSVCQHCKEIGSAWTEREHLYPLLIKADLHLVPVWKLEPYFFFYLSIKISIWTPLFPWPS